MSLVNSGARTSIEFSGLVLSQYTDMLHAALCVILDLIVVCLSNLKYFPITASKLQNDGRYFHES